MSSVVPARAPKPHAEGVGARTTILNVGISRAGVCGVRDYGHVLADALSNLGVDVETQWLDTKPSWGPRTMRAETQRWLDRIEERVERARPDWILWHYSVFSCSYRGLPTLARLAATGLAATRVPIAGILHELAYPFGQSGLRGLVYAVTQRAALRPVYRRLAAAVVTTENRVEWLGRQRWLPHRSVVFLPVCANTVVPPPLATETGGEESVVGIVGFSSEGCLVEPVVEAVRLIGESVPVRLLLIGAPGAESAQGRRWREVAERARLDGRLAFTGVLERGAYAAAIASVDVVLFPDAGGPSSRKTTLAAALAAGRPVVAVDGPGRWDLLIEERSALLVPPEPRSIADAVVRLCEDPILRADQGHRAEAFYRRHQAPDVLARHMLDFLLEQNGSA